MKILFICGSYPPEKCGVGDYLYNLIEALQNSTNINIDILSNEDWSMKNFFPTCKKIRRTKPDYIHIQYPSIGYKKSLLPQALSLWYKSIVTLHEVSHSKMIRRLSLFFFSIRSHIIFTNKFEYQIYKKYYPWFNRPYAIIPIGSNIQGDSNIRLSEKNKNTIVHFGQIRPRKGLEQSIHLAELLNNKNLPYKLMIVGQTIDKFIHYYEDLNKLDAARLIDWHINLSEKEVVCLLRKSLIAYFPFPDGASERRGSLFTAFINNMLIFTTSGAQTSGDLLQLVSIAETPDEIVAFLEKNTPDELIKIIQSREQKTKRFMEYRSWKNIASLHVRFFQNIFS